MIRFRVEWQDAPAVKDRVLARTWCRFAIYAGEDLVTDFVDSRSRSQRSGIYGSILPLAQWVVENWWFLLNESYRFPRPLSSRDLPRSPNDRAWVRRHSMLAAQEGGPLPDLQVFRDGRFVIARWVPDGEASIHPFLRFTGSGEQRIDPEEATRGLAELVDTVIDRLEGVQDAEACELRDDWAGLKESMQQDRNVCEWAARLGIDAHDPDELSDNQAQTLIAQLSRLDESVRSDLLDAEQLQDLQDDLGWLEQARTVAADAGKSACTPPRISKVKGRTAHELGSESATALRRHLWGPGEFSPVEEMSKLLHQLGWAQEPYKALDSAPKGSLRVAVERSDDGAPVAVSPERDHVGIRFALARSIFLKHFGSNGGGLRVVTDAHTWEQRASRAFAAELLAPSEGLSQRIGNNRVSRDQVSDLAAEYEVSPLVIAHQIENHRLAWID